MQRPSTVDASSASRTTLLYAFLLMVLLLCTAAPLAAQSGNPFLSTGENEAPAADQSAGAGSGNKDGASADAGTGNEDGASAGAGTGNEDGASAGAGTGNEDGASAGAGTGSGAGPLGAGVRTPAWLTDIQRSLYRRISGAFGHVRQQGPGSPAFLLLLLFAFLYGLLHALGPGHRKTVLFSYFLARGVPLRTGVAAGLSMALLHGASAIAIVLFIYYILRGALLIGLQQTETIMEQATFGLIALFGAFMLIKALLHLFHSGNAHEAGSEESSAEAAAAADAAAGSAAAASGGRDTSTSAASSGRRDTGTAVLVLFSGLLPCPGAAMILLFALSLDMLGLGLLTVIAMSLGMGVTLAAVALVTLGGRRLLLPKPGGDGKRIAILHHAVEAAGYMLVTLIGVFMYLAVV